MDVEMWPVGRLKPYPQNPRHNDAGVDAVAASIKAWGFRQPIVVDEADVSRSAGWRSLMRTYSPDGGPKPRRRSRYARGGHGMRLRQRVEAVAAAVAATNGCPGPGVVTRLATPDDPDPPPCPGCGGSHVLVIVEEVVGGVAGDPPAPAG